MASRVLKRTAFAFPVFRIDRLAGVRPMRLQSSKELIFRFASITSKFTIIAMAASLNGEVVFFPQLHGSGKNVFHQADDQRQKCHDHHHENQRLIKAGSRKTDQTDTCAAPANAAYVAHIGQDKNFIFQKIENDPVNAPKGIENDRHTQIETEGNSGGTVQTQRTEALVPVQKPGESENQYDHGQRNDTAC